MMSLARWITSVIACSRTYWLIEWLEIFRDDFAGSLAGWSTSVLMEDTGRLLRWRYSVVLGLGPSMGRSNVLLGVLLAMEY